MYVRKRYSVNQDGFTLIELSIVLVIIGLIAGSILVGKDLINAARVRQQISAIESYNTAALTFRNKYNALPGDISAASAAAFGFISRDGSRGCGDNNQYIGSIYTNDGKSLNLGDYTDYRNCNALGGDESQFFWADLASAGLISDVTTQADPNVVAFELVLPKAKVENGRIVATHGGMRNISPNGFGYYLIGYADAGETQISASTSATAPAFAPLSNLNAYAIDKKVDDGDPINGKTYTMNVVPKYGTTPSKGVMAGCATDNGNGTGSYDVTTPAEKVCVMKIKGTL